MRVAVILIAALCCACSAPGDRVEPLPEAAAPSEHIGKLRELYCGTPVTVREDMVVAGRITTSDEAGNFYRTFVVEDESGAVEVMAGLWEMYRSWPEGMKVSLKLRGLAIDCRSGVMRVGLPAGVWSGYGAEYMGHPAEVARYVDCSGDIAPVVPRRVSPGGLSQEMCGRLVEIGGMICADGESATWSDGETTGYRKFFNAEGDSVVVVTSPYARFSSHVVGRRTARLRGVLMYDSPGRGAKCYMLKLRSEDDVVYED